MRKLQVRLRKGLAILGIMSGLLLNTGLQAQEPLPTEVDEADFEHLTNEEPDGVVIEASEEQRAESAAAIAAFEKELGSRRIVDYTIAYLIDADVIAENEFVAPDVIANKTGALVIHDWETFIATNDKMPFQFVIVHASFWDKIDIEWTQRAFRNQSTVFIGISLAHERIQELTGDFCLENLNSHVDWSKLTSAYLYSYQYVVVADISADVMDQIHDAELMMCLEDYKIASDREIGVIHGQFQTPFDSQEKLDFLVSELLTLSISYGMP